MKLIKTAGGKTTLQMTRKEWHDVGDKNNWIEAKAKDKKDKKDGWPKKVKKGRFTEWCKRNGFEGGACIECAKKAMKSDDSSVRGMATFYMNTVKPKGKDVGDIS